ncbi:MAG: FGGY-family carbohydrate kinase [Actinomycetaceae bacterium]|nr:FGGY-family carbohydrate kinase [Actinomycetaceae bacterium]
MTSVTALAVDLGSSSGRIMAGTFDGTKVTVTEVHRFAHEAQMKDGNLIWCVKTIRENLIEGLRKAIATCENPISVSVDTWGVDMVMLDSAGQALDPVYAYRDERTARTQEAFRERLSDEAFWDATGISPAQINSANQLFALTQEEPELAAKVDKVLWLPDYFSYVLSGKQGWSRSIVSSSGLLEPGGRAWSQSVRTALDLPEKWFGELNDEINIVGPCIIPGLEMLTVVRGGGHDTACAVHTLPKINDGEGDSSRAVWLSCGSWSVLGVLRNAPLLAHEALHHGVTNEVRADGGIRPLFNLTGLWILQECQRFWKFEGEECDIVTLVAKAREAESLGVTFDPDDDCFIQPFDMVNRVQAHLLEKFGVEAKDQGQLVRTILESFAARYAQGIEALEELTGATYDTLYLLGGGSKNKFLCDLTAQATGIKVLAGPAEASALGSIMAQLESMQVTRPEDRYAIVSASAHTTTHRAGVGE